ncbi:RNA-binding protein 2-like [Punica granatum]|uniref:RNA-binding protein 2-like n=1 Tax=Punica granatum TaxID=22663 RepID=A0A6P8BXY9_PUNGR|nr:RNA-binding protein 2-like [Punica granatum]
MSQLPTMMGHPGPGPQRLDLPSNGLDGNFGGPLSIDPMSRPSMGREAAAPLPPDASSTLYVEGLPSNCTRSEVAHIFRPFVGFKEVRLVSKESKHVSKLSFQSWPLFFCPQLHVFCFCFLFFFFNGVILLTHPSITFLP